MHFQLNRIQLVICAMAIIILGAYANRLLLVLNGNRTKGEVISFIVVKESGYRRNSSSYLAPLVLFYKGKQEIVFESVSNLDLERGEIVPVIYSENDPNNAFVFTFFGFWFMPLIYALVPLMVFVAIPLSFLKYKEGIAISISPFAIKKLKRPPLALQ